MAAVTAKDIPETQAFMSDLWSLIKNYYKIEHSEKYYEAFIDACTKLDKKYNKNRLNEYLMIGFMEFIAEQYEDSPGAYRQYKADRIARDFIRANVEKRGDRHGND